MTEGGGRGHPDLFPALLLEPLFARSSFLAREGGGVLPYMGYIGMCLCEGYGFQAVYSRIGYINQSVWV